jgi:hypothetical protein
MGNDDFILDSIFNILQADTEKLSCHNSAFTFPHMEWGRK